MKDRLTGLLKSSLKKLHGLKKISEIPELIRIDRTRDKQHGDFATNIALVLAKKEGIAPRELAQLIVDYIGTCQELETIEVAGPGFINFYITEETGQAIIQEILHKGEKYGVCNIGKQQTINIEFVSANPTGPLHVGHGRGAAFGATVANLLEAIGFAVDREYYVNDAGRQMDVLTTSIWLRYLSLFTDILHFPQVGYKGDYIISIAKQLQIKHGDFMVRSNEEIFSELPKDESEGGDKEEYIDALINRVKQLLGERDYSLVFDTGLQNILQDIKDDLAEFGVTFQNWFRESSLVYGGDIKNSIAKLEDNGHIYVRNGAKWFRAELFGDEKDRVVVRENGQTTYFASDIGYHFNKYQRGYDKIIDIFGADHHGYAPRVKASLLAEGLDPNKFEVLLVQFAILYRQKKKVQMSTRSGKFVTLRELRAEVGNDAARFFYIMRKNDQHLDFDLDLAKSQSADNPVYYIQYAHARICSVMRQLHEQNMEWNQQEGLSNLELLKEPIEEDIIRSLQNYLDTLQNAALKYEPHLLAYYLQELANHFHSYYNAHKFIVEKRNLRNTRLCLIQAVKTILANGLKLLGVSAPTTM